MKKLLCLLVLQACILFLIIPIYGQSVSRVILKTDTDSVREDMSIMKEVDFWSRGVEKVKSIPIRQLNEGREYGFNFQINKPALITLGLYYYTQDAFVTPGDRVSFEIVPDSCVSGNSLIRFTGDNAQNYNYYNDLNAFLCKRKEPYYRLVKDLALYKKQIDEWRKLYNDFLQNYQLKYNLADDFIDAEQTRINARYIKNMYSPFRYNGVDLKQAPSGYFKEANEIQFNHPDLLPIYDEALACRYLFSTDTLSNIDTIWSTIFNDKSLSERDKEYLTTALIGYLAYKQKVDYRIQLTDLIATAKKTIKDPDFLQSVKRSEEYYTYVNNPFPDDVLKTTWVKEFASGRKMTLSEMLLQYKDKPVYIDFWASWCGGCLMDIKDSKEIKMLLVDSEVEYIYLSLDQNEQSWKNSALKEDITDNQFLLMGAEASPLYKYLKIEVIPQYIFLTSKHKINTTQAPRPIPVFKRKIEEMIDSAKEKIVFF